jgi:hypothetical protein
LGLDEDDANLDEVVSEELDANEKNQGNIADALKRLIKNFRVVETCGADETKIRIVKVKQEKSEATCHNFIAEVLTEVTGVLKTLAARTVITTALSMGTECNSPKEVQFLIDILVKHELLKTKAKGETVQIYHRTYGFGDYEFDRKDLASIRDAAEALYKALRPKEREWEKAKSMVMTETANIPLEEAIKGRTGLCLVHVPARMYTKDVRGQEFTKRSKKGDLLLRFEDKFIVPVSATGAISQSVTDIIERGADQLLMRKSVESLTEEPPFVGLARDLGKRFGINLADDWSSAEDCAKDFLTLWRMIRRASEHIAETAQAKKSYEQMEKVAEITPAEFFGLNGTPVQDKVALLYMDMVIDLARDKQDDVYQPFFLVKRTTDNGQEYFEVTEIPSHLQSYLGKYVGKKFLANDRNACPRLHGLITQIGEKVALASASDTTANTAAA